MLYPRVFKFYLFLDKISRNIPHFFQISLYNELSRKQTSERTTESTHVLRRKRSRLQNDFKIQKLPPIFYLKKFYFQSFLYLSICRRGNTELLELEEEIDFFDRNSGRKIASFKGQPVSRDLLKGACDIMVNPKYHLHTRCDVADALTVMLPGHEVDDSEYDDYNEYAGGSTAANVRTGAFHLFSENPVELMKLVRGVLQVYSDCERAGDYEVASKRRPLYRFFKYFNKNKACSEILSKIAKEANAWNNDDAELPIFLLFQTKLFQDANEFLTDGLQHRVKR